MKLIEKTQALFFVAAIAVLAAAVAAHAGTETFDVTGRPDLTPAEMRAWYFVHFRMQDGDGVIYYLANPKRKSRTSVVESMGQAMEFLALIGDRVLFEQYAESTERYFKDKKDYYYHWEIVVNGKKGAGVTALVDDLRIFKAYDAANAKGMGDYAQKMRELAAEIYLLETDDDHYPVSYYSNEKQSKDTGVNLFYLDVGVMDRMALIDGRWAAVSANAKKILNGMPSDEFGFYPFRYEIDRDEFTVKETTNMVENLYTALFALPAGRDVTSFADFLRREAKAGALYNIYKPDGTPNEKNESTAVYALAARFMHALGDRETAAFFYDRMLSTQIGPDSSFMGGFSMDGNESVYAFDQLEAMLAIRLTDL